MTKGFRNSYVGKYFKRKSQRVSFVNLNMVSDFRGNNASPANSDQAPLKQEPPKAVVKHISPYDVSALIFSRSN